MAMKNLNIFKISATISLTLFNLGFFAQDNYTLKMSMKMEGLPAEYAAFAEQEITTYIKGDKRKTKTEGMMSSNSTYYDSKKMTMLMESMGNKMGFSATKEEIEASDKKEKAVKPKIEYVDEKKTVAGYECSKAIVSVIEGKKETSSIIWYTTKINYSDKTMSKAQSGGMPDLSELKGFPLEMEMSYNAQGMDVKMIMTTTDVSLAPIPDSEFEFSTEGYKMMSLDEMKEMQKGRGQK